MSGNLFQKGNYKTEPIKSEVAPLLQQFIMHQNENNIFDECIFEFFTQLDYFIFEIIFLKYDKETL